MDNLSNDRENRPSQNENSHKLCDETDTPKSRCVVILAKSQWKLKQQHDQIFPIEGKSL